MNRSSLYPVARAWATTGPEARPGRINTDSPRDVGREDYQMDAGFGGSSPERPAATEHDGDATPLVGIDVVKTILYQPPPASQVGVLKQLIVRSRIA